MKTGFCNGVLAVVAVLVASCVRVDDTWESKRAALKNRPRPLILNSDGNEVIYWKTNLPVTVGNFTAQRLDMYRGSQVSTVAYCPQSSGFGLMTTTRAGEFFDVPRCIPELQPECHNAAPILKAMGLDCLDLTADYCRTNGMEIFVSIRVNDTHDTGYFIPGTKPPRSYLFPKWKDAHPECLFGSQSNKPPFCAWSAVDFENPVVRDYMKEFVRDFVENYDVDGIEYDFFRHGQIFKTVGWGAYATEAQLELMTEFMLELRAITEAAGRKKGRPILVLVRTSDSLAYAKAQGIDVEAWLRRGVMDIWSVSDYFQLDYLKPNAELAHRYGVKFNSALAESRIPGVFSRLKKTNKRFARAIMLPGRNTVASYAAEYSAAMAAGCDGISSFNLSCTGGINARGLLDVDPRQTKDLDKVYFALVRGSGGYRPESWVKDGGRFYVRPRIDPATIFKIPTGKPYVFGMEFGDEEWANFDVVAKAALAGGQEVVTELKVNGRTIAPGAFESGVHAFPLKPGDLRKGYNEFSVTLDPKFGKELTFHDFAVYLRKASVAFKPLAEGDASPCGAFKEKLLSVSESPRFYWAWTYPWLDNFIQTGDMRYVEERGRAFAPKPLDEVELSCPYQRLSGGKRAVLNYADLASLVGTWHVDRYYKVNRAGLTAAIKKQWREFRGVMVFNWHMDHPYCTNGFNTGSYRFKSCGENRNVVRQILDGTGSPCGMGQIYGKGLREPFMNPRAWFMASLRDVAEFFNGLVDDDTGRKIPVILRYPHEMDGNWFWWGRTWCEPDEFRRLCRLEADYLRERCPGQILFAYTPDRTWKEFGNEGDTNNTFLAYYPGDKYVDILGIDDYSIGHGDDAKAEAALAETVRKLRLMSAYAKERGQVVAISEAGGEGKRVDFWTCLYRAATAEGVNCAFVNTWHTTCGTLPESKAEAEDLAKFVSRSGVLMESGGEGP